MTDLTVTGDRMTDRMGTGYGGDKLSALKLSETDLICATVRVSGRPPYGETSGGASCRAKG